MRPFLDDVRILDLTRYLPGPYATTLLADLGAEVIKIEEPSGDPVRHRSPKVGDRSYTYLVRNRNKSSIALDLKDKRGQEAFLDLAETADVVIESFRPGVCDQLGVGYDDLCEINDDIIYCSLSGYGQDGPYKGRPGHDINYIGVGGLLGLTGEPGERPRIPGYPVGDFAGGLYAAFSVTAGLVGVGAGHGGEHIDVSITDVVTSFATVYADQYFGNETVPMRGSTRLIGDHPGYRVYQAADDSYLTVAALDEKFWDALCAALDLPELAKRYIPRQMDVLNEWREECTVAISERIAERTREEWLAIFDDHDVPAAPVNMYDDIFEDPHLVRRELFDSVEVETDDGVEEIPQISSPVAFNGDRSVAKTPGSRLGADTRRFLEEIGYDDFRISTLADEGVITIGKDI